MNGFVCVFDVGFGVCPYQLENRTNLLVNAHHPATLFSIISSIDEVECFLLESSWGNGNCLHFVCLLSVE
jgi:hypothetical protein